MLNADAFYDDKEAEARARGQISTEFKNERGEDAVIRVTHTGDNDDLFNIWWQLGWRNTGEAQFWLTRSEAKVLRDALSGVLGDR